LNAVRARHCSKARATNKEYKMYIGGGALLLIIILLIFFL
jgi:hypothetical protein